MSDLIIRKATEQDVHEIAELDKLCFAFPWSESAFEQELMSNPLAFYIVAETADEGVIVGYAGLWLIHDEGHITNVGVHPDFRRKKIGEAIVEVLMKEARELGDVKTFTLEVRKSNQAATALYEKFGFAEVGVRKGYYEDNKEDALIMWTSVL